MTNVTYTKSSQYYTTIQTSWYLSNWEPRKLYPDSTDLPKTLESRYNMRPDLLAYDLYGDTDLWWVFMINNPDQIVDPIYDFVTGLVIYVPTNDRLNSVLG